MSSERPVATGLTLLVDQRDGCTSRWHPKSIVSLLTDIPQRLDRFRSHFRRLRYSLHLASDQNYLLLRRSVIILPEREIRVIVCDSQELAVINTITYSERTGYNT